LEKNATKQEGILRLAGNSNEIKIAKDAYNNGESPDLSKLVDVHSVAGLLKLYFRELPQKLFIVTKGIKVIESSSKDVEIMEVMKKELLEIPAINYITLKRLFIFFNALSINSEINRMTSSNIATALQPVLQIPKSIIVVMINHPEMFVK